ncbi:vitellogenin-1-like [Musca vetustissima]|uniref:vitellogenin-1-like n=1 Tax=Musca vetustissima TaxID=27455 RepID=UPI002AB7558A|nr:vitellogenin-1-like [Musca vetustissima]
MNTFKLLFVVGLLAATASANRQHHQHQQSQKLKPSEWFSPKQLKDCPSLDDVTVERLENMSLEEGAETLRTIYHVSHINYDMQPSYTPTPSSIPVTIFKSNGEKVETTLDKMASTAKQMPKFGKQEITIYITGVPAKTETVHKANSELVNAYVERYRHRASKTEEENPNTGNLVVIDLGEQLSSAKRYALLDVEETGEKIAESIADLIEECKVPHNIVHIVAHNIAAHVAGAAGEAFERQTGEQFSRITALDPSKIYAEESDCLTGLARGDAEFVDAIHTSAWGMGTTRRVGDVDFFPNGPCRGVPGTNNVIQATMRAVRLYAESVRPGHEHNFPAVEERSVENYKNYGCGKRVHMGLAVDKNAKGDFILQVNEQSPFGQRAPAKHNKECHKSHRSSATWSSERN